MQNVSWVKLTTGDWPKLHTVNLPNDSAVGIYTIWHGGNPSKVVYVGQGIIAKRLASHRTDRRIQAYNGLGLYVTWASVAHQASRDGYERFLADKWNPLIGDAHPDVVPIAVNSPW